MPNSESVAKIIGEAVASALNVALDKSNRDFTVDRNKRDLSPDNDFENVSIWLTVSNFILVG